MKSRDKYILWSTYFDITKTRREGRRVPKALAVEAPQTHKIYEAAARLNLNPVEEQASRYPRFWWGEGGRVLVDKKDRKHALILSIARELERPTEKGDTPLQQSSKTPRETLK